MMTIWELLVESGELRLIQCDYCAKRKPYLYDFDFEAVCEDCLKNMTTEDFE